MNHPPNASPPNHVEANHIHPNKFDIPHKIPYIARIFHWRGLFPMMTAIVTKQQVKRVKQPDQRSG